MDHTLSSKGLEMFLLGNGYWISLSVECYSNDKLFYSLEKVKSGVSR